MLVCQFGCEICVKLLLDRSEEKEIDLNKVREKEEYHHEPHEYEHCLFVANYNCEGYRKDVVDLLLRSAEAKGIDIHTKRYPSYTLRDEIIKDYEDYGIENIEEYTEETYKILKIDPSVDLKRK